MSYLIAILAAASFAAALIVIDRLFPSRWALLNRIAADFRRDPMGAIARLGDWKINDPLPAPPAGFHWVDVTSSLDGGEATFIPAEDDPEAPA